MRRLPQAALVSALFTIYGGSFYYLYALLVTEVSGGDIVKTFTDTVTGLFFCWVILTVVFYELLAAFDDINKINRRRDDKDDTDSNTRDLPQ